jgi:hypothetical protein
MEAQAYLNRLLQAVRKDEIAFPLLIMMGVPIGVIVTLLIGFTLLH